MNEQANPRRAKAEAARINRKLARAQSRRRVMVSSFALFALVFTLLSFRLTTGLDPSTANTVATTNTPSVATAVDLGESETSVESDDADENSAAVASSSAGSTTSSQTAPAAPTTKAS